MAPALDFTGDVLGVAGARAPHLLRRYGDDPGPGFTAIPYTDSDSSGLLDEAIRALVVLRGGSVHDPGAKLSVLVTLAVEAEARIPDAVFLARTRHGYSWGQVAERLGLVTETARRRYADYVRACSELLS
ncbi:MAG: hypothetical protein M0014_16270 [Actinomycetota bacterium]|jgi:hypothetical protein|nr:hypothetical protein [Actinomycetota bacterium]MDA8356936.1 hypothetical protein [Actinomycetota bacterium]